MTTGLAARDESGWGLPLHSEAICLSEEEMARAAALVDPSDEAEPAWTRYLRGLALAALRRELKRRDAAITIGPELSPEDPQRLLALNGRATQLLCISPQAESVEVALSQWRESTTAPQLLLLALVDEEHGVVEFPGVLDGGAFVAEIRRVRADAQEVVELPLERFGGGLVRLLRWLTLVEPEALPRMGISGHAFDRGAAIESLQRWLEPFLGGSTALVPIPVTGTRGGGASRLKLITPEVKTSDDGSAFAQAVCSTPSIWATTPLAEIQLEQQGKVVWHRLATRSQPIEGPIRWPLEPLQPQQCFTVRLRPYGEAGGAYAVLSLVAPDRALMRQGEEEIEQGLQSLSQADLSTTEHAQDESNAVAAELRVRLWIALTRQVAMSSSDD